MAATPFLGVPECYSREMANLYAAWISCPGWMTGRRSMR